MPDDRSLGLRHGEVRVVPYDPAWPRLFEAERARLAAALEGLAATIEHTGSTAVPGLAAKPVIDILIGYGDTAVPAPFIERLVGAGYEHRGEQGIPGREFFRRGVPRSWHIHLAPVGSAFRCDHRAFRDALRADPAVRDAYAALKLDLAARFPRDRERYIEGKTEFVRRVLAGAGRPER